LARGLLNQIDEKAGPPFFRGPDDGMDAPCGKVIVASALNPIRFRDAVPNAVLRHRPINRGLPSILATPREDGLTMPNVRPRAQAAGEP
jgi:hypothetical protein